MKGVILAGGLGTRLLPLTKITNKHLLPVFNRPMIHYPIECLRQAGIRDILVVTGGNSAGDFLRLLENGDELGVSLSYAYQRGEGGIADALRLAERFAAIAGELAQRVLATIAGTEDSEEHRHLGPAGGLQRFASHVRSGLTTSWSRSQRASSGSG